MSIRIYGTKDKAKHYVEKALAMLEQGKMSLTEAARKREIGNMKLVIECYDNMSEKDLKEYKGKL